MLPSQTQVFSGVQTSLIQHRQLRLPCMCRGFKSSLRFHCQNVFVSFSSSPLPANNYLNGKTHQVIRRPSPYQLKVTSLSVILTPDPRRLTGIKLIFLTFRRIFFLSSTKQLKSIILTRIVVADRDTKTLIL